MNALELALGNCKKRNFHCQLESVDVIGRMGIAEGLSKLIPLQQKPYTGPNWNQIKFATDIVKRVLCTFGPPPLCKATKLISVAYRPHFKLFETGVKMHEKYWDCLSFLIWVDTALDSIDQGVTHYMKQTPGANLTTNFIVTYARVSIPELEAAIKRIRRVAGILLETDRLIVHDLIEFLKYANETLEKFLNLPKGENIFDEMAIREIRGALLLFDQKQANRFSFLPNLYSHYESWGSVVTSNRRIESRTLIERGRTELNKLIRNLFDRARDL